VISGSGTGPSPARPGPGGGPRRLLRHRQRAQDQSLGLEGVTLVESHGRGYVLVAAMPCRPSTVPLTGIAALHRSPEEAAILASLQATNRWNEFDD
jgi:hypothetical protein